MKQIAFLRCFLINNVKNLTYLLMSAFKSSFCIKKHRKRSFCYTLLTDSRLMRRSSWLLNSIVVMVILLFTLLLTKNI